jgi:hypothetical protein
MRTQLKKLTMLKIVVLSTIMCGALSGITQAAPAHWRTPEKDSSFASRFSKEDIEKTRQVLSPSQETERALEAKALIGLLISKNSDSVYNAAAAICDERASDVSTKLLISKTIRTFQDPSFNLHPLASRYAGHQFVNVAIRSYCPSLMTQ